MAECGFPCNCTCLSGQVDHACVVLNGRRYIPAQCLIPTTPGEEPFHACCDCVTPTGFIQTDDFGGRFNMMGNPGSFTPYANCNCVYFGGFSLYPEGAPTNRGKKPSPIAPMGADSFIRIGLALYVFDSGILYVNMQCAASSSIDDAAFEFTGYGGTGISSCKILCYEYNTEPPPAPVLVGRTDMPLGLTITAVGNTDFQLSIRITTPEDQHACQQACIVSKRVTKDCNSIFGQVTGIRITPEINGRCPKFGNDEAWDWPYNFPAGPGTSVCTPEVPPGQPEPPPAVCGSGGMVVGGEDFVPAPWKTPGWGCMEFDGTDKKDCAGNDMPSLYEWITRKYFKWPNDGMPLACALDCCDLFVFPAYAGGGFEDPAAWWHPNAKTGWVEDVRGACDSAWADGLVVYMFEVNCKWYFQAVPPENTPPFTTDEEGHRIANPKFPHVVFRLSPSCGYTRDQGGDPDELYTCRIHQVDPTGITPYPSEILNNVTNTAKPGEPPVWEEVEPEPGQLKNLEAYAGDKLTGAAFGTLLEIKSLKVRQKVVEVTDGNGNTVSYPMCETETYLATCATWISPYAPTVTYLEYPCTDCHPGCYDSPWTPNEAPKEGFVPDRYLSEKVFASVSEEEFDEEGVLVKSARQVAVERALALGKKIQDTGTTNVIPYAHGLGSEWSDSQGCCVNAWHEGGWNGYNKPWSDTEHVVPCDIGIKYDSPHLIIPGDPDYAEHPGEWTATLIICCQCKFPMHLCDYNLGIDGAGFTRFTGPEPTAPSVSDPEQDNRFCVDYQTGSALAETWMAWAESEYNRACWAFVTGYFGYDHWQYDLDVGSGNLGGDCGHAATNHGLLHRKELYTDTISDPGLPRWGIVLSCRQTGLNEYAWTGSYDECRWCNPLCGTSTTTPTGSCPNNNCLTSVYYYCPGGGSWDDTCTEEREEACVDWISHRQEYNTWAHQPIIAKCNSSIGTNGGTPGRIVTCGVPFCGDKCGRMWVGSDPQMAYGACVCSGYGGNAAFGIGALAAAYADAVASCAGTPMYCAEGYSACGGDNCGDACANPRVMTSPSFYEEVTTPGSLNWVGGGYWSLSVYKSVQGLSPWPAPFGVVIPGYSEWYQDYEYYIEGGTEENPPPVDWENPPGGGWEPRGAPMISTYSDTYTYVCAEALWWEENPENYRYC